MPEGPECRITANQLKKELVGKLVVNWFIYDGKYNRHPPGGFNKLYDMLPLIVADIDCKGKTIYFTFCNQNDETIYVIHSMRMTGSWVSEEKKDRYCCWFIETDDGKKVYFRNPRQLATIEAIEYEELQSELSKLGPDILTDEFNLDVWKNIALVHKNKNITSVLMNQKIMSGCGNYLKSEVLYDSGISPLRKIGSLDEKEVEKMYNSIKRISSLSLQVGGMSARDYRHIDGSKGEFYKHVKAYNKPGMVKKKTSDGRTTYWNPDVQK